MEYPCKDLSVALVGGEIAGVNLNQYYHNFSTGLDNLSMYLYEGIHYFSGEPLPQNVDQ